ncbi:MAG: serine/threonine-protein kinase [Actinomycetota bacterium]
MATGDDPDLSSRLVAGRYDVGEALGHGGMGGVWMAEDRKLKRKVAVKLLSPQLAAKADVRERFEAEALASGRLNHPNVVSVYDAGEHEGIPFLVMELLSGRTLAEEFGKGPLNPERVIKLGLQALAGLQAAHTAGIVHRDIKPGNILFTTAGDSVKVADFGIAKGTEGLDADLTQTGVLIGTPAFLAPERISGKPATALSDLYSLGVVLYEALAGRRPFVAETVLGLASKIQNEEIPPLRGAQPDLDPKLASVVERAMSKIPEDRFQTAGEMAEALAAARTVEAPDINGQTVVAPVKRHDRGDRTQVLKVPASDVPGKPLQVRRTSRLRPGTIAAGLAVATLLLIAAIIAAQNFGRAPAPTPTFEPSPLPSSATPLPSPLDQSLNRLQDAVRPA